MANSRYRDQQTGRRPDVAAQNRVEKAKGKVRELYNSGKRLNRSGASQFYRDEVDVQRTTGSYTQGYSSGTGKAAGNVAKEMDKKTKK